MKILVCGGAGYIGSHCVYQLIEQEYEVVVLDNLSTGFKKAIDSRAKFYCGDILDEKILDQIFTEQKIEGVIHFAANSLVFESMQDPIKYYNNNVTGTQVLLKSMIKNNIDKIIFSSTAAVYGNQDTEYISEENNCQPENAYGETKVAMEKMIKWCDYAHDLRFVSLRYFNVAGANPNINIGEAHDPETHLIPNVLKVPLNQKDELFIFGDDYNTNDGTCIRDYIHVVDLCSAHIKALEYLIKGETSDVFNLGYGHGFSVKEIVDVSRKITGHEIPAIIKERRAGDPDRLVAQSNKAKKVLNWTPEYDDLEKIITTAWNWHKNNPKGYDEN